MSQNHLKIDEHDEDGVRIVRLEGSLMRLNTDELRRRLGALESAETQGVALDFRTVDDIDSAALGAFAASTKAVTKNGARPYVMFGASRLVTRVWTMIGLDGLIPSFADKPSALARIREETDG